MQDLQSLIDRGMRGAPSKGPKIFAEVHTAPFGERVHREQLLERAQALRGKSGAHLGVAGFFNFEFAAVARPTDLVLLDVNYEQQAFWKETIAILASEPTPQGFMRALHERARMSMDEDALSGPILRLTSTGAPGQTVKMRDFGLILESYLEHANWITDADNYHYLHTLATQGHIATARLDLFRDGARLHKLSEALQQQGIAVRSGYWSNVGEMVAPQDAEGKHLSSDQPVFTDDPQGLYYDPKTFYRGVEGRSHWNGEEADANGKPIAAHRLPAYEKMLRTISHVGDKETMHMMTRVMVPGQGDSLIPDSDLMKRHLLVFEGPPRNIERIAGHRARLSEAYEATRER